MEIDEETKSEEVLLGKSKNLNGTNLKLMSQCVYLVKMQHPQKSGVSSIQMDAILLVLFVQMEGMNIAVVHGLGAWASDENTHHNVILVYKGNGEFLPTQKGIS